MNLRTMLLKIMIRYRNFRVVHREETDWEPLPPQDLEELGVFIQRTYRSSGDTAMHSIKHMNWELHEYGSIGGDLNHTTYTSYMLYRMGYEVYRANIWKGDVVCIFDVSTGWQVIDNKMVFPPHNGTRDEAILQTSQYDTLTIVYEPMTLPMN